MPKSNMAVFPSSQNRQPGNKEFAKPHQADKKKKNQDTAIKEVLFARKNLTAGSILRENDTETKRVKKIHCLSMFTVRLRG